MKSIRFLDCGRPISFGWHVQQSRLMAFGEARLRLRLGELDHLEYGDNGLVRYILSDSDLLEAQ